MAIEGLRNPPNVSKVNVSDHVGAMVEALCMLNLVDDREQVAESILAESTFLERSGVTGETFVQLPRRLVTLEGLTTVSDNATFMHGKKYPPTSVYGDLWTPGTARGYGEKDLDNLVLGKTSDSWRPHVRLAVYNPECSWEPLVHFLDKPFNDTYSKNGEQTQLEALRKTITRYRAKHPEFAMTGLNTKAIAFISLVRRIKDQPEPIKQYIMYDPTLPVKCVDRANRVGTVFFRNGGLRLEGCSGYKGSSYGVGLSVGPKDLRSGVSS